MFTIAIYRILLLLAILLGLSGEAMAGAIADAAAKLSPGQWTTITEPAMTGLNATSHPAFNDVGGSSGPGFDGGQPAWDSTAQKWYIETAEHGASATNDCPDYHDPNTGTVVSSFPTFPNVCWKNLWTYTEATSTWTINGPFPVDVLGGGVGNAVQGVHVYGGIAWDNVNRVLYVKKHDWGQPNYSINIYRYCVTAGPAYCAAQGANTWAPIPKLFPSPNGEVIGQQMGWHAGLNGGTLVHYNQAGISAGCGKVYGYKEGSTGTNGVWSTLDDGATCKYASAASGQSPRSPLNAQYSTSKNLLIFGPTGIGATLDLKWWKMDGSGTITQLDNAPCAFGTTDGTFGQAAEDPVTGNIIFIGCTNQGQLWQLNPTAALGSQWTQLDANLADNGGICTIATPSGNCGIDFYATPISTYGVIAYWKFKHTGNTEIWLYKNSSGGDIVAPIVSITAPANAAMVSGATVTVTASASDNVGVAGVLFKLDGAPIAAEDISSPFSVVWDTTATANGSHALTAVARDAAGNTTTSTTVNVTIDNAPSGGGSDFATRCAAAGVKLCVSFDSDADISCKSPTVPAGSTFQYCNAGIDQQYVTTSASDAPVIDTTVKASGAGSLKFTIPSLSGSSGSGSYFTNYSTDLSVRYGANTTHYVQWRQRFSPEYLNTAYHQIGGGPGTGWKLMGVTTGDSPPCSSSNGTNCHSACEAADVVVQNTNLRKIVAAYHSCTGSSSEPFAYAAFEETTATDILLQNARTVPPGCGYAKVVTAGTPFPPDTNCVGFFANEWMTFKMKVTLGPRGGFGVPGAAPNDEFVHSNVKVWVARENQASELIIDWNGYTCPSSSCLGNGGHGTAGGPNLAVISAGDISEDQQIGKVYLLPYHTAKDPTQVTPVGYTWYDELIVSDNDIADPNATASAPAAPSGFKLK